MTSEKKNLDWFSLKPIKKGDYRWTISVGRNDNDEVVCTRLDIRYFVNEFPTSYGVSISHYELLGLIGFIDGSGETTKTIGDLTIKKEGGLHLSKKSRYVLVDMEVIKVMIHFLPAIAFIMRSIPKWDETKSKIFDCFIHYLNCDVAGMKYTSSRNYPRPMKINNGKKTHPPIHWLKKFNATFPNLPEIESAEFENKWNGQASIVGVHAVYDEDPRILSCLHNLFTDMTPSISIDDIKQQPSVAK